VRKLQGGDVDALASVTVASRLQWRGRASGPCRWVGIAMTSWGDLTIQEKTALRHLAKGEVHDVPIRLIQRLQALGLADGSPEGRLTGTGLELYRTSPRQAGRRKWSPANRSGPRGSCSVGIVGRLPSVRGASPGTRSARLRAIIVERRRHRNSWRNSRRARSGRRRVHERRRREAEGDEG